MTATSTPAKRPSAPRASKGTRPKAKPVKPPSVAGNRDDRDLPVSFSEVRLAHPIVTRGLRAQVLRAPGDVESITREGDTLTLRRGKLVVLVPWVQVAYAVP